MPDAFKVLVLSTAHVSQLTAQDLDLIVTRQPFPPEDWRGLVLATQWQDYGWWVWADIEDGLDELPPDLRQCLRFARDNGCRWLQFDCDGQLYPQLQTFDW